MLSEAKTVNEAGITVRLAMAAEAEGFTLPPAPGPLSCILEPVCFPSGCLLKVWQPLELTVPNRLLFQLAFWKEMASSLWNYPLIEMFLQVGGSLGAVTALPLHEKPGHRGSTRDPRKLRNRTSLPPPSTFATRFTHQVWKTHSNPFGVLCALQCDRWECRF